MNESTEFDDLSIREEWHAQERGMLEERNRRNAIGTDIRVQQYRLIARALKNPPVDPIPHAFAQQVATSIEVRARALDDRVEVMLLRMMIAMLVLAGAATFYFFGGLEWLSAGVTGGLSRVGNQSSATSGTFIRWAMIALACVVITSAMERWTVRRE